MDKDTKLKIISSSVIAAILIFCVGFFAGSSKTKRLDVHFVENSGTVATTTADFGPFWEAWKILNDKFVQTHSIKAISDQEKVWGAIQGLAASYGDPYTVFFPPKESKNFSDQIQGNFDGVGLEIGIQNNVITVIAPIKDNPAYKAGIKSGDQIVKINGTSTATLTVDEAVSLIRGPKGTNVTVSVLRKGLKNPVDYILTRQTINIPTIDTEMVDGKIFVIHLYNFSQNSPGLFRNALRQFVESGSHKLILDLRDNPGGYLEAAVNMASWYLPTGKTIVTEDYGKASGQSQDVFRSVGYNIFNSNLKMIVLVNGGTASASEILAAALQQYGVAKLLGEQTFGKGSVQELLPLTNETSLKVTVARWLTPNGTWISEKGLAPDMVVPFVVDKNNLKNDNQLDRAIEELKKLD